MRSFARVTLLASIGVLSPAAGALAIDAFAFSVTQSTSTVTYNFGVSAPFTGSLLGENDPLKPAAERTRTKRFATLFSCGAFGATQNDPVTISGAVVAAANNSSGTPVVRPSGTFKLGIDPIANTCVLQDFDANLVASGAISFVASLNNFTYQSFCTVNPSCSAPFLFAIPALELGSVSVTSLRAAQAPSSPAAGTLTPGAPNSWTFSVPVSLTVTPIITLNGGPIATDPQIVPAVVTGTITRTGTTATVSASTNINASPPANTTPTPLPAAPLSVPTTSPLCPGINVLTTLTLTSQTITTTGAATINASGAQIICPCDPNGSGTTTVADIFEYLNRWFTGDPRADLNGGGIQVSDIFDFLNCWFSPPLGC